MLCRALQAQLKRVLTLAQLLRRLRERTAPPSFTEAGKPRLVSLRCCLSWLRFVCMLRVSLLFAPLALLRPRLLQPLTDCFVSRLGGGKLLIFIVCVALVL